MRALKGLRSALGFLIPTAALLLIPAGLTPGGTWTWTAGLVLLGVLSVLVIGAQMAMAVLRPASFEVRRGGLVADKAKRQPLIDAIGLVGYAVLLATWLAFIPVDVFTLHLLPRPAGWVSGMGLATALAGATVAYSAVWQNRFAAPTIHEQAGQQVIDSGVYGLIRHPLYAGNLMLFAGAALWLGSTTAALATAAQLAATLWRIRMEEAYLRERLPAYADYARRVRGRLIPFVL
jgi:protein-S-isoprenylcysteine O-methyltransferase Ste14